MSRFLFRVPILSPHAADELAGLGPDRGGVDRGRRERGVSEDGGDRGERDAGGDRGDSKRIAKAPGARLGALDAGAAHDGADLAVRGLPRDGPKRAGRPSGAPLGASHAVHELEGVCRLGDRDGPPVACAALQGRDPEFVGLEVDVAWADGERFTHSAPGHRESAREGLDRRFRVDLDRGEEAFALFGGEVLAAGGADQVEGVVGHGPKSYLTLEVMTSVAVRLGFGTALSLAIAAGPRPWPVRECSTI